MKTKNRLFYITFCYSLVTFLLFFSIKIEKSNAQPLPNGENCTDSLECDSQFCVDGVCCEQDCNDTCKTCNSNMHLPGQCVPKADFIVCDESICITQNGNPIFIKKSICLDGVCVPQGQVPCDDSLPCTNNTCDPVLGCIHPFIDDDTPCDDGNACTLVDTCQSGTCVGGQDKNCSDGNQCTSDECVLETGICINNDLPLQTPCEDGDLCTENDFCMRGMCFMGNQKICDDFNICTTDFCLDGICLHTNNSLSCDDLDDCTENDFCLNGVCQGTPIVCDDDNICTDDECTAGTCQSTANANPCDDGDECTVNDTCSAGTCLGIDGDCSDQNECTEDACHKGICIHFDLNNVPCRSEDNCLENGTCVNGECIQDEKICDDDNDCTTDTCIPETGCVFTPVPNDVPCRDPECTLIANGTTPVFIGKGLCDGAGFCSIPPPIDCNDNNNCTIDTCSVETGCINTIIAEDCCQTNEECDDDNECTKDVCEIIPETGLGVCLNTPVEQGFVEFPCGNSTETCLVQSCVNGTCVGNETFNCSENVTNLDPCISLVCVPGKGCIETTVKKNVTGCTAFNASAAESHVLEMIDFFNCTESGSDLLIFDPQGSGIFREFEGPEEPEEKATLTGILISIFDPSFKFELDMIFTGRVNPGDIGYPPPGSPKIISGAPDTSAWRYYTMFNGTLRGLDAMEGALVEIFKIGPAFQIGIEANGFNMAFGASGWIQWKVINQSIFENETCTLKRGVGEININLTNERPCIGRNCTDGNRCTINDCCGPSGICEGTLVNCTENQFCNNSLPEMEGENTPEELCDCLDGFFPEGTCNVTCNNETCPEMQGVCNETNGMCDCLPEWFPSGLCDLQCTNLMNCNGKNLCINNNTENCPCIEPGICNCDACHTGSNCSVDICYEPMGECNKTTQGEPCDTNKCLVNQTCNDQVCSNGVPVDCNDQNQCTNDTCDPLTGRCINMPIVGKPCRDRNLCTKNEMCNNEGVCIGQQISCDDNNTCTRDSCSPRKGCIHKNLTSDLFCVRSKGFWKTHNSQKGNTMEPWPNDLENKLLCNRTYLSIMFAVPKGGDRWVSLAQQYIAALLNIANGTSNATILSTLEKACNLLKENCDGIDTEENRTLANKFKDILEDYNTGHKGIPSCDDIQHSVFLCDDHDVCTIKDKCIMGECRGEPKCGKHAICDPRTGKCKCDKHRYGLLCKKYCGPLNCCPKGGYCQPYTGECVCYHDSYGDGCFYWCNSTNCNYDGGHCDGYKGKCICKPHYYGENCKKKCDGYNCNPLYGRCDDYTGECKCKPGHYGEHCKMNCSETNCNYEKGAYCDQYSGKCVCPHKYYTDHYEDKRNCSVHCDNSTCPHYGGTCNKHTGKCECRKDFYPHGVCKEYCTKEMCSNHGHCDDEGECKCYGCYGGIYCNQYICGGDNDGDDQGEYHDRQCYDRPDFSKCSTDPCLEGQFCKRGKCVDGVPVICDDGNECTTDSCDPMKGKCIFERLTLPIGSCNDSDFCTKNDRCKRGICVGKPISCSDNNTCTKDKCSSRLRKCIHIPKSGKRCNDNDKCTRKDICIRGHCEGKRRKRCNEKKGGGHCDPNTGKCICNKKFTGPHCKKKCNRHNCPGPYQRCKYGECICESNHYGQNCSHKCNEKTNCYYGHCVNNRHSSKCECDPHYYGKRCDRYCSEYTCDPKGGHCDPYSGKCVCKKGYHGDECNRHCDYETCNPYIGYCDYKTGICKCKNNYYDERNYDNGDDDDDYYSYSEYNDYNNHYYNSSSTTKRHCSLYCNNEYCGQGGYCNPESGECQCRYHWFPPGRCNKLCIPKIHCNGHGKCDYYTGRCKCYGGYWGKHCKRPPTHDCKDCYKCKDGSPCNTDLCIRNQKCYGGRCKGGEPVQCESDNICLRGECNSTTGNCDFTVLKGLECNDRDRCTVEDKCRRSGECKGRSRDCSDDNICTIDHCDRRKGCLHFNIDDKDCDDKDKCTFDDKCMNGTCQGTLKNCNNHGACDPDTGKCICDKHFFGRNCRIHCNHESCPHENAHCDPHSGKCKCKKHFYGKKCKTRCDHNNCDHEGGKCNCTTGKCECRHGFSGDKCDKQCDKHSCPPRKGECKHGVCKCKPHFFPHGSCHKFCKDNETCNNHGQCNAKGKCECEPEFAGDHCQFQIGGECENCEICDNGISCNTSDCIKNQYCFNGQCQGGEEIICDDNNQCTFDACDPNTGCIFISKPTGDPCDDGFNCTIQDRCDGAELCIGIEKNCTDENQCTRDICVEPKGCLNIQRRDGIPCDDANKCTKDDKCKRGVCVGKKKIRCSKHGHCDKRNGTCVCKRGFFGRHCEKRCDHFTCEHGKGHCNKDGVCICHDGFFGKHCHRKCNKHNCDPRGGKCDRHGVCRCKKHHFGHDCSVHCDHKTCPYNKGYCDKYTGNCICKHDSYGKICNITCDEHNCKKFGGHCSDYTGICKCREHWFGYDCSKYCSPRTCPPHKGECNRKGECICKKHFFPHGYCTKFCNEHTCNRNGYCDENTGDCICKKCWSGCNCDEYICANVSVCKGKRDGVLCNTDPCKRGQVCLDDRCTGGTPVHCNDHNECTKDFCDKRTGKCKHITIIGKKCREDDKCFHKGRCKKPGICVGTPITCDDDNQCTKEFCLKKKGCIVKRLTGINCDDMDECTLGDICIKGICEPGIPIICEKGICDPDSGQCNKECNKHNCHFKGGKCNNETKHCECFKHFYGEDCSKKCDKHSCKPDKGKCDKRSGKCHCIKNHFGSHCDFFCNETKCKSRGGYCYQDTGKCGANGEEIPDEENEPNNNSEESETNESTNNAIIFGAVFGSVAFFACILCIFYFTILMRNESSQNSASNSRHNRRRNFSNEESSDLLESNGYKGNGHLKKRKKKNNRNKKK